MMWVSIEMWRYLLKRPLSWCSFWCRVRGHQCGVVWMNPGGIEPDMHCKNCDDDLG